MKNYSFLNKYNNEITEAETAISYDLSRTSATVKANYKTIYNKAYDTGFRDGKEERQKTWQEGYDSASKEVWATIKRINAMSESEKAEIFKCDPYDLDFSAVIDILRNYENKLTPTKMREYLNTYCSERIGCEGCIFKGKSCCWTSDSYATECYNQLKKAESQFTQPTIAEMKAYLTSYCNGRKCSNCVLPRSECKWRPSIAPDSFIIEAYNRIKNAESQPTRDTESDQPQALKDNVTLNNNNELIKIASKLHDFCSDRPNCKECPFYDNGFFECRLDIPSDWAIEKKD